MNYFFKKDKYRNQIWNDHFQKTYSSKQDKKRIKKNNFNNKA